MLNWKKAGQFMEYLLQDIISRRIFARKSTSHHITNYDNGLGFRPTSQGSKGSSIQSIQENHLWLQIPPFAPTTGRNVYCRTSRIILYNASLGW